MMKEGRDFSKTDLQRHFTKTDRIDRILNDILSWEE